MGFRRAAGQTDTEKGITKRGRNKDNMSQALTFQLQTDEIRVSKVFQKDTIGSRGLEVKGDVSTCFSLKSGEMQVRRWRIEGCRVPVASYKTDQRTGRR